MKKEEAKVAEVKKPIKPYSGSENDQVDLIVAFLEYTRSTYDDDWER